MSDTTDKIQIRAADGRRVLDPRTMLAIGADGLAVGAGDTNWYRRWLDGDVEVFDLATGGTVPHPAAPPPDPAPSPSPAGGGSSSKSGRSIGGATTQPSTQPSDE